MPKFLKVLTVQTEELTVINTDAIRLVADVKCYARIVFHDGSELEVKDDFVKLLKQLDIPLP